MTPDSWQALPTAPPPRDRDLEIAVIEKDGSVNALVEPVCWTGDGWRSADGGRPLDLEPTHWRPWPWNERIHV